MSLRPEGELKRVRLSVSYYPQAQAETSSQKSESYLNKLYPSMLIQDIALRIMPPSGRFGASDFQARLTNASRETEKLVVGALAPQRYRGSLAEVICTFFSDTARLVTVFGTAVYEIVYLEKPPEEKAIAFEFTLVQPGSLVKRGNRFYQTAPPSQEASPGAWRQIELPYEKLLIFDPPSHLGGKLTEILDSLAKLSDKPPLPDFVLREMERAGGPERRTLYDSQVHLRAMGLALAATTKEIGWDGRKGFDENVLKFYALYRRLLFERFIIQMRNDFLSRLNDAVVRALQRIGLAGQLETAGLPTLGDVDMALEQLQKGEKPFGEIMKPFL